MQNIWNQLIVIVQIKLKETFRFQVIAFRMQNINLTTVTSEKLKYRYTCKSH